MKFFLISDNRDTYIGMRLVGTEGVIVQNAEEARRAVEEALARKDIGILMLTEKLAEMIKDLVYKIGTERNLPLLTILPDRHGSTRDPEFILKYLKEAVGIKL